MIDEAKNWIGTPYKKDTSCKNVGCDCIGLIYGIFTAQRHQDSTETPYISIKNTKLQKNFNFFTPQTPHKHPLLKIKCKKDEKNEKKGLPLIFSTWYNANIGNKSLLEELYFATEEVEQISNGTIGVFVFDDVQPHLGLITKTQDRLTLIHAHESSGKVVEHRLYGEMLSKLKHIYKFKEV